MSGFNQLDKIRLSVLSFKAGNSIRNLVIFMILINCIIAFSQAWKPDPNPDYEIFIMPFVKTCDIFQYPQREGVSLLENGTTTHDGILKDTRNPVKWWINCLSYKVFDTPKFIPILFNLGLMPLVYFLSKEITKDKLLAFVSFTAFTINPLYSKWISNGTYDQIWAFFLILSVYLLLKERSWPLSIFSFFISLASKSLSFLYLPALFYSTTIEELDQNGRNKKHIFIFWVVVISILGLSIFSDKIQFLFGGSFGFHPENINEILFMNLAMLWNIIPILTLFILLSVYFKPRENTPGKRLTLVWIINAFLTTEIIYIFTDQFQFVYRFVPLAVFMSIFISISLNDTCKSIIEIIRNRNMNKIT